MDLKAAIISQYSTIVLTSITETERVYCAVRPESVCSSNVCAKTSMIKWSLCSSSNTRHSC